MPGLIEKKLGAHVIDQREKCCAKLRQEIQCLSSLASTSIFVSEPTHGLGAEQHLSDCLLWDKA